MAKTSISIGSKDKSLYDKVRKTEKNQHKKEVDVSLLKVIEVLAESEKSWEDAAQCAVNEASKSVRNIKSVYLKEMQACVVDSKITTYRINAKISFEVEK